MDHMLLDLEAPDFKDAKKTTVTKKVKKNTKYKVSASGQFKGARC